MKILKYASYTILLFGFFFITYHVGLMKGKQHERVHGENVIRMSDCFESTLFTKCTHTHMNSEPIKRLYEELLNELRHGLSTTEGTGNNSNLYPPDITVPSDSIDNKKLSMK